ncbi:hypothetical protein [Aquimarina algiphila]|uniref:hypothetical protein n=1 Tax=Aquimarina algiphila TaxID=2047982 RepID=UPI002492BBF2|nr:hypothetical protein [Aquimarina algiphila]
MKKFALIIMSILSFHFCVSQEDDNPDVDRGVSYGLQLGSNENISIPLYNITIEGTTIPITLSYNSKGTQVSNVPTNVGFGWNLNAGGGIQKTINHLVDESPDGWFFHNRYEDLQPEIYGNNRGKDLFESVDAAPDIFRMRMSNGFLAEYVFDRITDRSSPQPLILKQNGHIADIITNLNRLYQYGYGNYDEDAYQSEDEYDIKIRDNKGVNFLFRRGVKRNKSWDLERRRSTYVDSSDIQNYYVHKILTDQNTDFIQFEYVKTELNKFTLHGKATRLQTNSDPRTPPSSNDPVITNGYESQISVQDESRKDIKKITTPYETIEFLYKEKSYYNSFIQIIQSPIRGVNLDDYTFQKFKLLDEIKIYDHKGNYISGYKFNYTEQTQDQDLYEGSLKIKSILKYAKNHKDTFVYRKFDYYYNPAGRENAVSMAQDVYGYPNGARNNSEVNITPVHIYPLASDKLPSEDYMIKGMLKAITNPYGGKTEYVYKENSYNTMYYGGLLIQKINTYDNNGSIIGTKEYTYENPEGFGLPIYDQTPIVQGQIPEGIYDEGYYEESLRTTPWESYFTKRDPWMDRDNLQYLTAYAVSNIPYELKQDTPIADTYIENLQLQNFNQLQSGSFYKTVTTKRKNVVNNQYEKGYTIQRYRPSLNGFQLDKRLERTEYFNSVGKKQKETIYNYDLVLTDYIIAYQFDNVHYKSDNGSVFRYQLEPFPIYKTENVLRNTETIDYDDSNNTLTNRKDFTYLNEDNSENQAVDYRRVKTATRYYNNTLKEKTENKYLSEYDSIPFDMQYLFWRNPAVETNNWVYHESYWRLRSSSVTSYLYDGKPLKIGIIRNNPQTNEPYTEQNFVPSFYDTSENLNSLAEEFTEFLYDGSGRLQSQKDSRSLIQQIYQRSEEYDGLYIDAVLTTDVPYTNGATNFFLKKSFENSTDPNVISFDKAFSGNHVYTGNSISLGNFPADYEVSYWSYTNNEWKYHHLIHQGGILVINKPQGATYIDEIRVQPKNSTIEAYTLQPLIGTTSALNNRGDGQRIEHDVFNRALYYKDKNQNVLRENRINLFKNQ